MNFFGEKISLITIIARYGGHYIQTFGYFCESFVFRVKLTMIKKGGKSIKTQPQLDF